MTAFPYAAAALVAALFSQSAAASCYVVYGPDKTVVYRSYEPPVDMSRQIHETLPVVAPGSTLVFTPDDHGCRFSMNKLPLTTVSAPGGLRMRPARADRS
ncbi:hypothetical protein [Acidovorax radicis]|uniref:hypothetical protein n=1 Tax=Acidovorax radicis TaxID=758826 RepID=UPI001CFBC373|nr:hypothetical protein [Acidovorax radicis]UCV01039.1 hypothetical protein KI609_10080 [Acidovorax radicis]